MNIHYLFMHAFDQTKNNIVNTKYIENRKNKKKMKKIKIEIEFISIEKIALTIFYFM
jgi:hypothetical protein